MALTNGQERNAAATAVGLAAIAAATAVVYIYQKGSIVEERYNVVDRFKLGMIWTKRRVVEKIEGA